MASAGAHAAGLAAFLLLQWSAPAPEPGPIPVEMVFEAAPTDAGSQQAVGQAPGTTETPADADAPTLPQPPPAPAAEPDSAPPPAAPIAVEEAAPIKPFVESAPVPPATAEVAPPPPETLPLPPVPLANPLLPSPEPSPRPAEATKAAPIPVLTNPAELRSEAPKAARPASRSVVKRPEQRQESTAASPVAGVPAPFLSGSSAAPVAAAARPPAPPADAGPVLITNPRFRLPPAPPAYPQLAREQGQEGEAVIRARLDLEGNPEEVVLQASSGVPMLDRAALAAVRRWAFEPGRRGGEPVIAWVQIPVRFALR